LAQEYKGVLVGKNIMELPPGILNKILGYRPKQPTFSSCLEKMKPDFKAKPKHSKETISCLKLIILGTFRQFCFKTTAQQAFNNQIKEISEIDRDMGQLILAYVMCILKEITNESDRTCIASRVMFSYGNFTNMAKHLWVIQREFTDDVDCNNMIEKCIKKNVNYLRLIAASGII
jgi:hypothetical protein